MVTPRQGIAMFSIAAVLPLLVLGLQENKPGTDPANREGPVMRVEVNKLANSKRELASPMQRVKIAFVDEDRLALTFMTPASSCGAQMGKPASRSSPILFRTIFLDVKTGQVRAGQDWSSDTPSFELIPTHDGRFLLATFKEIKLYSASFELLGHRELPPKGPGSTFSHATVSWGGHTLIVESYEDRRNRLELVDADTLQVKHSWITDQAVIKVTSADNGVAIETRNQIQFSATDESWRTVYTLPDPRLCTNLFIQPEFIGNDALAFRDCNNQVTAIDTSGKLLFKSALYPSRTHVVPIITSRNGRVFGALVYKSYCAASWLECMFDPIEGAAPERVVVYDALNGRPIYERRLEVDRKHPLGEIALSPHGSLLAVLSRVPSGRADGIVEVFRLPALESSRFPERVESHYR